MSSWSVALPYHENCSPETENYMSTQRQELGEMLAHKSFDSARFQCPRQHSDLHRLRTTTLDAVAPPNGRRSLSREIREPGEADALGGLTRVRPHRRRRRPAPAELCTGLYARREAAWTDSARRLSAKKGAQVVDRGRVCTTGSQTVASHRSGRDMASK